MSGSNLLPHSCQCCQKIVIDGTGPDVSQVFVHPFCDVKAFAEHCALFRWTLKFPTVTLKDTHKLFLSILTDCEDLAYLNVEWKDEHDPPVTENETGKSTLHIFTSRDDSAADFIKSRPLAQSKTLQHYRKRLENCSRHKKCKEALKRRQHNMAPTRLLYTPKNSHNRLYTVSQGEHPCYVALSYCWGKTEEQEKAKTMRANVQDRHGGIELSQLPQTIRDAVKVTQSLELSYLWVDALCIIQDDQEDCNKEIANMASIYRGSTITIVAASAKSSTEGFLRDRDLVSAYGSRFELPYRHTRGNDVTEGSVQLSEQPVYDTYEEPIDKRAWTMQEDILSLRLLRFGSKQTTWRCLTHYKNLDGGCDPSPENVDPAFTVDNPYRVAEVRSSLADEGKMGYSKVWDSWQQSISKYTHRELSKASDKLPGCAALAENFADILGLEASDYLAGLWKNDIEAQLLWFRPKRLKSKRTSGPTWSWASLDGPVEFFQRSLLEYDFDVKAKAKFEDIKMTYKFESHKYSEVESGRLSFNGLLQEAYWDGVHLRRSINCPRLLPLEIYWDLSTGMRPQTIWCLEIIGSHFSLGLVLASDNQDAYERVGFFECCALDDCLLVKNWFNEVEEQTVTIC